MKKPRILFLSILTMAILGGILAFKAKKADGFCVYQTYVTTINHIQISACTLKGQFITTPFPNGGIHRSVFTTRTLCDDMPTVTPISRCTGTLTIAPEF